MKTPKFDVKEEVYVKCKVISIETGNGGWMYTVDSPSFMDRKIRWIHEDDIVSREKV